MKKLFVMVLLIFQIGYLYAESPTGSNPGLTSAAITLIRLQVDPRQLDETLQEVSSKVATKYQAEIQPLLKRAMTESEKRSLQFFWYRKTKELLPYSRLEEMMVPVIVKNLTLNEIQEINNFLNSPVGVKLRKLQPIISNEAEVAGMELARKIVDKAWLDEAVKEFKIQFPQWESVIDQPRSGYGQGLANANFPEEERVAFLNGCIQRGLQRGDNREYVERFCHCSWEVQSTGMTYEEYLEMNHMIMGGKSPAEIPQLMRIQEKLQSCKSK